jgi:DNA-binding MarR family transcriptional regulator
MIEKLVKVTKTARLLWGMGAAFTTVGELARWSKMPKSTVRRIVEKAIAFGLLHAEFNDYKKTGRWELRLTEKGHEFAQSQLELF